MREQALYELRFITDQGMIVPDTTHLTIPFLIELLPHRFSIKDRDKIIELLVDIIEAAAECRELGPHNEEARLVYKIIAQEVPLYLRLLDDDEAVRYQVSRLLKSFPEHIATIQPILTQAFAKENSERVQLAMLYSWEELTS